jgi:hypothetical protein
MADTYKVIQPNAKGPDGPFLVGQEIQLAEIPSYLINKVKKIEVATPPKESGSEEEEALRAEWFNLTGEHFGGNMKIKTMKKKLKEFKDG